MDAELLSEAFVELVDTMVAGFDVIDFLHVLTDRSVQLLDVSAAGLLLADPRGDLRGGRLQRNRPAGRAVPAAERSRSLPGLLPVRPTHRRRGPGCRGAAVAAVRVRRPAVRVRGRAGPADAAGRGGHRRAEPFPGQPGSLRRCERTRRPGHGGPGHYQP